MRRRAWFTLELHDLLEKAFITTKGFHEACLCGKQVILPALLWGNRVVRHPTFRVCGDPWRPIALRFPPY
jgi:hypothetical protein